MKKRLLLIICIGLLSLGTASNVGAIIMPFSHYHTSVVPDHSLLQAIFSITAQSRAGYLTSEKVFILLAVDAHDLWPGFNSDCDAILQDIESCNKDNVADIKSRLDRDSDERQFRLLDSNYLSGYCDHDMYEADTFEYHIYSRQVDNPQHKVDNSIAHYGIATGDGISSSSIGHGSTQIPASSSVPIPGAIWLFGSGLISLFVVSRRRK